MRRANVYRYSCYLVSLLLFCACLFCLLWVVSSSSMAFSACEGKYDLFAENARCRQPPLAAALALVSLVASILVSIVGYKRFK